MTPGASAWSIEVGGRRITVNVDQFPRIRRLAEVVTAHWAASFGGADGSSSTASVYATSLRDLLAYLNDRPSPPQDLRFVDDVTLDAWVDDMRNRVGRESTRARATSMRVLLDNFDQSLLHNSLTDGRVLRWRPDVERGGVPLSDLSPGQWATLSKLTKRAVLESTARIRAARAIAVAGRNPTRAEGWRIRENVYWAVLNGTFDLAAFTSAHTGRRWARWLEPFRPKALTGARAFAYVADRIREQLLPTLLDMAAFWTAMAITTGLPPESVNDLELGWFDRPPGGDLTILRYRKQRRAAPTIPLVLLTKPQFSAQRLRDTYVELSRPLRALAGPDVADRLWLFATINRSDHRLDVRVPTQTTRHFTKWVNHSGLLESAHVAAVEQARTARLDEARAAHRSPARLAGRRLRHLEPWTGPVDPRRIRKTNKARRLVLFGLAAAATDHTVRVLIAHYTNSDLVRVRSAMVITDIADTLVVFAQGPRPATLIAPDVADAARDGGAARSQLSALLGITETQLDAILAGRHTIGAVACIDPHASPYDRPGRFCRQAGSELCLSCQQAVVLSEHVPSLWSEVERLDRIGATMSGESFHELHGEQHALLLELLGAFDGEGADSYRARGTIPTHAPGTPAPVPMRRRRVRR